MTNSARIAVVTVSAGRVDALLRKARSLTRQTLSTDRFEWALHLDLEPVQAARIERELREATPQVRLDVHAAPVDAVGAGRNQAAMMSSAPILLLSDDDVVHVPGALEAHAAFHEARSAAGRRAAVAIGALALPESMRDGERREPFERPARFGRRAHWMNATGANTSLPRRLFEAVGGYDPQWSGYGGEDPELFVRVARSGATFWHLPAGRGEHLGRVTDDTGKARAAGAAHVRVARRHGGAVAWWLGVHPVVLSAKRIVFRSAASRWLNPNVVAYEKAYLHGALRALEEEYRAS